MSIFDRQLGLAESPCSGDNADALNNSRAVLEYRIIEFPESTDAAYEFITQRDIGIQ